MAWNRWIFVAGLVASSLLIFSGRLSTAQQSENDLEVIEDGESISSTNGNDDGSRSTTNAAAAADGMERSCCRSSSASAIDRKPYVIVSTLDGRINAIDASEDGNGRLVWSLQTDGEPLLASSLSNIPFIYDDSEFRLIPSMDGHFYMYNDAAVQSVPFNVDALLSGSLKLGADVLAGGKNIRTYFVDYVTGKLRQTCSASGCEQFGDQSSPPSTSLLKKLIIKRTTQTVRGVDPTTGAERWNLTIGEHELLLDDREDEETENSEEDACICVNDGEKFLYGKDSNTQPIHSSGHTDSEFDETIDLKLIPPEGVLLGYDKNDPSVLLWETKLDSPIVQIWTLSAGGRLVERTIFDQNLIPAFSYYSGNDGSSPGSSELTGRFTTQQADRMIYIGTYNDQKYVIRSPDERRRIKDLRSDSRDPSRIYLLAPAAQLQLEDQSGSSSGSSPHCGSDCPTCASEEVNGLILRDQYPRDMGWYLYKHKSTHHNRLDSAANGTPRPSSKRVRAQRHVVEFLGELSPGQFCLIFMVILAAICIPAAVVARSYGHQLRELKEIASKCLMPKEEPAAQIVRLPSTTGSPVTESTHLTPTPSQESNPLAELVTDVSGRSYGRYNSDFEPIEQLGKGGFGIVVESRNKHDDQLYAVKRIGFALNLKAKERVRREVKALAQLEHPGIVRYFSAWFEEPPAEWQQKIDQELFQKCHRPIDDELNLDSNSTRRTNETESVRSPRMGLFETTGDRANDDPSTFGTWSDDVPADGRVKMREDDTDSDDEDASDAQRPLLAQKAATAVPKIVQESVEIIFAHSTTAASTAGGDGDQATPVEIAASKREKRKSSSSKHSSTTKSGGGAGDGNNEAKSRTISTAYLYIQMQLCRGTLKDWLLANTERDRSDMLDWFDQLVCAMQYVHELGLVHRDLKPSNIFFSTTGLLKIGDFGLATTVLPTILTASALSDVQQEQNLTIDINNGNLLLSSAVVSSQRGTTDRVGTQLYMSPEQEAGKKCTSKADIYALGLILIELLMPFKTLMERVHVLQDARKNMFAGEFKKDCAEEFDLVQRLLAHDPDARPTCMEIRQFDMFKPCLTMRPLPSSKDLYHQAGRTVSRDSGRYSNTSLNSIVT